MEENGFHAAPPQQQRMPIFTMANGVNRLRRNCGKPIQQCRVDLRKVSRKQEYLVASGCRKAQADRIKHLGFGIVPVMDKPNPAVPENPLHFRG